MNLKKEYPRVVALRQWFLPATLIIVVVVCSIILFNFSHEANALPTKKEEQIHQTANVGDVKHFEDKAKTVTSSLQNMPAHSEVMDSHATLNKDVIPPAKTTPAITMTDEGTLKAMSATIDSNVIHADLPDVSKTPVNSSSTSLVYLSQTLENPISPYEVKAGTIIPGILITGINSDLPGEIIGMVRSQVYDTVSGNELLIPQGAKLLGVYNSKIVYGQKRVLIAWHRIIFPNGQSISLEGMPGIDLSGYSGFKDKVDNHYAKLFSGVLLMSVLSAGAQLSQPQESTNPFQAPSVGQTIAQSVGLNIANTATEMTNKNLNIEPTLIIRQGYLFNILVTKDMVFPHPYQGG